MPKNRPSRATRRSISLASDSTRIEHARSLAQSTLAAAGSLSLFDLYAFAQDAVHHLVVLACPSATDLRQHIVERVLDRITSRLTRHGPGQLSFASVQLMEGYLKRTIRTNLIDARRARAIRAEAAPMVDGDGTVTPVVEVLADPSVGTPGSDMIDPAQHALLVRVLNQGLGALSPDARQALHLSLQDLTAPEIGEAMGRTAESVRQLLSRGIRSLHAAVTEELEQAGIPATDIGSAQLQRLAELTVKRLAG